MPSHSAVSNRVSVGEKSIPICASDGSSAYRRASVSAGWAACQSGAVIEITAMHLGTGIKHYAVLGLTDSASDDDIRSAFRKLASDNHPDRAKGEAAAARFREVNDAYQELRKLRGL